MWAYFFPISVFLSSIVLRTASESTANISYLIVAGYAMRGPSHAIQALSLSWLLTVLNNSLVPEVSSGSVFRYVVILAAALSVAFRSWGATVTKLHIFTLLLGLVLLAHSFLFSIVPDVSILKTISWLVVVFTLLFAWQSLPIAQRNTLLDELRWWLIGLMVISLPLVAIPSVGYATNGHGFQGLLNHPQAFGLMLALVGAMLWGQILKTSKPSWVDLALLGLCLVLIVLTEARTAGVALALGLIGSVVFLPTFGGESRRVTMPGLHSRQALVITGLLAVATLVFATILAAQLSAYVFKHTDEATVMDLAEASRGELVYRMLDNIEVQPLTGIGFGISSRPETLDVERDPLFGLPISAPIEKGVMPIAIVEELGAVAALAVFAWVLVLMRCSARSGVGDFSLLITILMINLGEYVLFSPGGMGMLVLALMTGAVTGERREMETTTNA